MSTQGKKLKHGRSPSRQRVRGGHAVESPLQLNDKTASRQSVASVASPYDLLGVSKTASAKAIKAAYKKKALEVHPDKGGTTELFATLANAYNTLRDPTTKADYDSKVAGEVADLQKGRTPTQSAQGNRVSEALWGAKDIASKAFARAVGYGSTALGALRDATAYAKSSLVQRSDAELAALSSETKKEETARALGTVTAAEREQRDGFRLEPWTLFYRTGLHEEAGRFDRLECEDVDAPASIKCRATGKAKVRCFNYDAKRKTRSTCQTATSLARLQEQRRIIRNRTKLLVGASLAAVGASATVFPAPALALIYGPGLVTGAVAAPFVAAKGGLGNFLRPEESDKITRVPWAEYKSFKGAHGVAICTLRATDVHGKTCAKGKISLECASAGAKISSIAPCLTTARALSARAKVERELLSHD